MIPTRDKWVILLTRADLYEKEKFKKKFGKYYKRMDQLTRDYERWFIFKDRRGSESTDDIRAGNPHYGHLVAGIEEELGAGSRSLVFPEGFRTISDLLQKETTTVAFIQACGVSWAEIEDRVSPYVRNVWNSRYEDTHFITALASLHEAESREIDERLRGILGTYIMYRHHSVYPGLVREIIRITDKKYNSCAGIIDKYHLEKFSGAPIDAKMRLNAYIAGFQMIMLCSRILEKGKQSEFTCMQVDLRPWNISNKDGGIDSYFAGVLTSTMDTSETLMAERTLLRKISPYGDCPRVALLQEGDAEHDRLLPLVENGRERLRVLANSHERVAGGLPRRAGENSSDEIEGAAEMAPGPAGRRVSRRDEDRDRKSLTRSVRG